MRGDRPPHGRPTENMKGSSPHAWGSSRSLLSWSGKLKVFPTCVGIVLFGASASLKTARLPHMRGDRPSFEDLRFGLSLSSPHAWGSSPEQPQDHAHAQVFPTCVGIVPVPWGARAAMGGLPHMRGDRPLDLDDERGQFLSSPHAWGSSPAFHRQSKCRRVFPTCVGIVPVGATDLDIDAGLPHMRGDRPWLSAVDEKHEKSSPHAWGSSHTMTDSSTMQTVFPTCVGIVPFDARRSRWAWRLPHMRGDRPFRSDMMCCLVVSSPHAWGSSQCSDLGDRLEVVFPTCVGIVPQRDPPPPPPGGLPHMRGDRPHVDPKQALVKESSPHAWGSSPYRHG